jgi:CheY-like chemotaxis protein
MHGVQISSGNEDNSVLIVNDAPEQLGLMERLLVKAGYSVFTAEDGVQGLNLAKKNKPDLVISDVSMPHMNGLEFCNNFVPTLNSKQFPFCLSAPYKRIRRV